MASDTGAPWNLPYPEDTDLVRDGASDIEALAVATAAGLTDASVVRQVVQTVKTDTFTTTSSAFAAITGMSVDITPSSNTSKVLVVFSLGTIDNTDTTRWLVRLMRGSTAIAVGDADGARAQTTLWANPTGGAGSPAAFAFLDTPATDLAVTYSLEASITSGTFFINRSQSATDAFSFGRAASSIIAIEVAG